MQGRRASPFVYWMAGKKDCLQISSICGISDGPCRQKGKGIYSEAFILLHFHIVCMLGLSRVPSLGTNREILRQEARGTQQVQEWMQPQVCSTWVMRCLWETGTRPEPTGSEMVQVVVDTPSSTFFVYKMFLVSFNSSYSVRILETDYQVSFLKVPFTF